MNAISERTEAPVWASRWLGAAGIYNLLWGATTIAFPHFLFDVSGIDRLNYPEIWQCVGMIVGVYGIGYLIAAGDSRTHWPIVLVGLLGKVFGPIGFMVALLRGTFPPLFGLTILTNDLLWWIEKRSHVTPMLVNRIMKVFGGLIGLLQGLPEPERFPNDSISRRSRSPLAPHPFTPSGIAGRNCS